MCAQVLSCDGVVVVVGRMQEGGLIYRGVKCAETWQREVVYVPDWFVAVLRHSNSISVIIYIMVVM